MQRDIRNPFCEIIAASESMWHERKGFDTATNIRSMKMHFRAINKELDRIKKNIELLETQEFVMIKTFIEKAYEES